MEQKRRQIVLINKNFQFRLITKFILVNIAIMILFGGFLYTFLNSEIDSNLHSAHVNYKNIKDMLLPIIVTLSILNILVSSIIIGIFVLFASHKIAGPLFRFNEALKNILNKNLNTITSIREEDQLYECSATLKKMTDVLKDDMSKIKSKITELKKITAKDKDKPAKTIAELEEIINRYTFK